MKKAFPLILFVASALVPVAAMAQTNPPGSEEFGMTPKELVAGDRKSGIAHRQVHAKARL